MKILVSGAAGFIGSHVAERLSALSHEVVGVDAFSDYYSIDLKRRNEADLAACGISILHADLNDGLRNLPTDFNYIFHLAAQPGISPGVSFESYVNNNLLATNNLLEFALLNPQLRMFVNISTSSVYGRNAMGPESAVAEPASYYGVTKLAAEQLALQFARSGKLNACSLRLFSVFGPRERPDKLFTRLFATAMNGSSFPLYEGSEDHTRSFTYVGDIVEGIVAVIGKEEACNEQIINLGCETEVSTAEAIHCVEEITGKQIRKTNQPARYGDQLHTCANIGLAKKLLDYEPKTSLRQGLEHQYKWFKGLHVTPFT